MFVAPLKNNIQASLLILLMVSFGLWAGSFMFPHSSNINPLNNEHVLFHFLFYKKTSYLFTQLITLGSILLGAFFVNFLVVDQEITSKTNYLPAFFYILFAFAQAKIQVIEPTLIANLLLLPAINFLIIGYRQETALTSYFKAGLFFGLASFFYIYYLLLFPIAFIAIYIFRAFNWREWFILFIGIVTPLYFYFNINYLINSKNSGPLSVFKNNLSHFEKPIISEYYLVFFVITVFITGLAIFHYLNKGMGGKIKTIKTKYVIIWLLFLSLFIVFYKQTSDMILTPCIIPLSIIMGDYLSEIKQLKIANTLLFLFISGFAIIYCHALGLF